MPDTSDLEFKAEQSMINWLLATSTHGVTIGIGSGGIFHGVTDDLPVLPAIFVDAEIEDEYVYGSRWYTTKLSVMLKANAADTTDTQFEAYWEKIRAIINWDQLKERLSDLSGFHCWMATGGGSSTRMVEDGNWKRQQDLRLICMARDNA